MVKKRRLLAAKKKPVKRKTALRRIKATFKRIKTTFEIGDQVEIQSDSGQEVPLKLEKKKGIIRGKHPLQVGWMAVEVMDQGVIYLHDCDGQCPKENGWYVKEKDLVLISRQMKIPETVDPKMLEAKINGLLNLVRPDNSYKTNGNNSK